MKLLLEKIYGKFLLIAASGGFVTAVLAGGPEGNRISTEQYKESAIIEPVTIRPHVQVEMVVKPVPGDQVIL